MNRIDYNGVAIAGTMWSADWPFRLPATADRSRALNGFVRCAVGVPEGQIWAQRGSVARVLIVCRACSTV